MANQRIQDWRDVFCGRAQELEALRRLYTEVAAAGGPRLCVVLGDRGMGKTRLVQEFYRHISNSHDPHNYWPDASLFAGNNLRVAPELDDPQTQAHYARFVLDDRPMPFLWWGFRLADPIAANAAVGGLAAHRQTLDLHLVPALFGRSRSKLAKSMSKSVREHGQQLGKKAVLDLVKTIPAVGSIATLFEWGVELSERTVHAATDARKAQVDDQKEHESTLSRLGQEHSAGLLERTVDDLAEVLAPREGLAPLPVVVFCDDAQFGGLGGDEGALRLLERLWERAHLGGWPLLLVLTHWAVEWHQRVGAGATRDAAGRWPHVAATFAGAARSPQFGLLLELSNEPELVKLVRSGLPGFPTADEQLLLSKADGNPQSLVELIELVRRSPAWRLGEQAGLTAYAREQIERRSSRLVELIRERLESDATPEPVRQSVALSSLQGQRFLCTLTHEAAKALHVLGSEEGLLLAQHPHRLVVDVEAGVAGFVQRAYREAAECLVGQHLGDPAVVRQSLVRAAIDIVDDADHWAALTPAERAAASGVLVALGESDTDAEVRLHAARALLRLVSDALGAQGGADYDRAAELAERFLSGLGERWLLSDLFSADLSSIHWILYSRGQFDRAQEFSASMLALAREALETERNGEAARKVALWAAWNGSALQMMRRSDGAEVAHRERLGVLRELATRTSSPEDLAALSKALEAVAGTVRDQGRWAEAEALSRESLGLRRELADRLGTRGSQRDVIESLNYVGNSLQEQGRWDEAEALYRECLHIARRMAEQWDTPEIQWDIAEALDRIGQASQEQSRWDQAEALFREGLGTWRALAELLDLDEIWGKVAASLERVGRAAQARGGWDEAEGLYRESLGLHRKLANQLATPEAQWDLGLSLWNLAKALRERGERDAHCAALLEAREVVAIVAEQLGTPDALRGLKFVETQLREGRCVGGLGDRPGVGRAEE